MQPRAVIPFPLSLYRGFARRNGRVIQAKIYEKSETQPARRADSCGRNRTLGANHFMPLFCELFLGAPDHLLPHAGHYSFEDAPEDIAQLVSAFITDS